MRVFQIIHSYPPYLAHFESKTKAAAEGSSFAEHKAALLQDRFYAAHILQPALNNQPDTFFTMWDYPALQLKWARERGWAETDLKKILRAQLEEFRPDIFYNCSPIRFTADEIRAWGGRDTLKLAWYASPEHHQIDFSVYRSMLSNYPPFIEEQRARGVRCDLFQPSYDPAMDDYAGTAERPVDILFYGQYASDYFKKRNVMIDRLVRLKEQTSWNIRLALQYNPCRQSILPSFFPARCQRYLRWRQHPSARVRRLSEKPLYGLDLYAAIARSKIVFNATTDMCLRHKVNMRNIEALGCGAHMIGEAGDYPEGLQAGRDFSTYANFEDFVAQAAHFLKHPTESRAIAGQGHASVARGFSKAEQWRRFQEIASAA